MGLWSLDTIWNLTYEFATEVIAMQMHFIYIDLVKAENNSDTIWLSKKIKFTWIVFF